MVVLQKTLGYRSLFQNGQTALETAKEIQCCDFDALIAHTTIVFIHALYVSGNRSAEATRHILRRRLKLNVLKQVPQAQKKEQGNGQINNMRRFNSIECIINFRNQPDPSGNVLVYHRHSRVNGLGGSPAAFHGALDAPDMGLGPGMRTGEKQIGKRCSLGRHRVLGSGSGHPFRLIRPDSLSGEFPLMPDLDFHHRKILQRFSLIRFPYHSIKSAAAQYLSLDLLPELLCRA
jgi:hypothetical protein